VSRDEAIRDILQVLRTPQALLTLDARRTTELIARARTSALLGRIAARVLRDAKGLEFPPRLLEAFEAPLAATEAFHRMARFETDRVGRCLAGIGHHIVLLKGSAYVLADLPAAIGRPLSDVDILLPREAVAEAEARLIAGGWEQGKTDDYDQMYFREWMHELPPLRHRERMTVIDLHHTILPPTGRLRFDAKLLIADAIPVAGWPGIRVLAPADMVLHSVVHHFQDGEFQHTLRELVDLDDLIRHFRSQPDFWDRFVARTEQLGFGRPAFYALRHAARLLDTPIPDPVTEALRRHAPPAPILAAMDRLIPSCLLSSGRLPRGPFERAASEALYLRAQWLKMPPALLARHTASKIARRFRRMPAAEPVKA
jgi:hypothetical protein